MTPFTSLVKSNHSSLKVSLCTTCMGRFKHLMQTLPENIKTFKDDPNVEFCIMAYGDEETAREVKSWAEREYPDLVKAGRIRLGYTEAESFHPSHAKNLAHLLSSPDSDVVCNIDADNFASKAYVEKVREVFKRPGKIYLQKAHWFRPSKEEMIEEGNEPGDGEDRLGHMGRLAMRRHDFLHFGYEERIEGWGGEDTLIAFQMDRQGFRHVELDENLIGDTIHHKDDSRVSNMSIEAQNASKDRLEGRDFPSVDEFPIANPDGFGVADVNVLLGHNKGLQRFGIGPEPQKCCASR